jgi:hypothetical protein
MILPDPAPATTAHQDATTGIITNQQPASADPLDSESQQMLQTRHQATIKSTCTSRFELVKRKHYNVMHELQDYYCNFRY